MGSAEKGPAVVRHFKRTPSGTAQAELDCSDPAAGGLRIDGCTDGEHLTVAYDYLGTTTL